MDRKEYIERIKEIEKQQTLVDELFAEDIPKKKKYTLRMDIRFDKELTTEEACKAILTAFRSVGVVGHCGSVN